MMMTVPEDESIKRCLILCLNPECHSIYHGEEDVLPDVGHLTSDAPNNIMHRSMLIICINDFSSPVYNIQIISKSVSIWLHIMSTLFLKHI